MARQVLPWVGAAVGAIWGQPQLGFAIGSLIGNAVDPQVIKGPQLGEGQANTASEGGYRPIVLGKGAVGVCMIHQGPEIIRTIRHRQSKGGGPKTEEQRRYRTMAFALGESAYPETGVQLLRLWIDNKLVYDVTPTSQIPAESAEFAQRFTFYPGNETQEPDPDLEAMPVDFGGGVGNVPSYRGGCPYIVFPEYDVTDSVGRAPMIKAELASQIEVEHLSSALVIGRRTVPTQIDVTSASDNGLVWDPEIPDPGNLPTNYGAFTGDRFVRWGLSNAYWSDTMSGPWQGPFGSFGGGGEKQCYSRTGVIAIPAIFGSTINVTTNGQNFTTVNTGVSPLTNVRNTALNASACLVYFQTGDSGAPVCVRGTPSATGGWVVGGEIPIYGAGSHYLACSDDTFVIGGQDQVAGPKPRICRSANLGTTWSGVTLSASSGARVMFLETTNDGRWVAAIDNGEIWYSLDDGQSWTQANQSLGRVPRGLGFNGERMIIAGGDAGDARIMTAEVGNLAEWSIRSSPLTSIELLAVQPPQLPVLVGDKVPLYTIATWIHDRVDIPSSKYNVSELTDLVEGVVFADGYTGAAAMQSAMGVYSFGAGEYDAGSGYKLNYVKHGKPAAVTLTEDDVVEGPEDWEREDSYERPRVLHVAYPNPIADYGAPNIVIKRTSPDVLVVGERSVSVPFVFSDADEITRKADVMMTVIYTEIAGTYKLVLPWSLLALAPTDPIGFSIRGRTRRLRLEQWRFSPDGTISTEFMADRQSAWTSNVTGLPAVPSTPPPPSIVGPTVSAALDIPALTDSLDSLHQIVAASGMTPAWYGSDHQRKLPSDADFTTMLRFTGVTTIMGTLQDDVTAASPHYTDTTNVVRVTLYRDDELVTHTQQQFLSEGGAFALSWDDGGVRRWEVGQYRDAVKVGDQEWELTTLARGRLNTDAEAHPAGSLFVLLDAGVRAMPMQSSMIGQDITHRAVSLGQLPDQAVPYTEPYTGESQREWPVAHLFVERDGDDIDCTCVPRHRFGTDNNPIRSANWSGYRWTATDGSNTATADTLTETHTFDVSGWASPVTVTVAQLNRITGAGPAVSESIA